ncbi:MAG: NAD(+) diphosphatase [Sporichthyaceae bacterium]|nr:NAD(+) diphosphatase [Sporichthyaceae bacterium]
MSLEPLRDLRLARAVVDRAAARRTDPAWLEQAWASPRASVLQVCDGKVLVDRDSLVLDVPVAVPATQRLFLGEHEERPYFAAIVAEPVGQRGAFAGLREIGGALGARDAGLVVHAISLANWHATHTHCPRCGSPTVPEAGGHLRRCISDDSEHYPRTDPAVIMSLVDGDDRLLLGRQASWSPGRFSTLAGFVEPGESLEAAVRREVDEEVGIGVGEVGYLGSQPWPFPSSLMLGFRAQATSTDVHLRDGEIAEARWFTRDQLLAAVRSRELTVAPTISIARRLIEQWYGGRLPTNADS